MAKATWRMPEDFLMKVSRLADKTDEILPKVLETGAEVVEDKVEYETQEARLSLVSKGNYLMRKGQLSKALLAADFVITDRRYIGHEDDTGYHHYAMDVAKLYGLEE